MTQQQREILQKLEKTEGVDIFTLSKETGLSLEHTEHLFKRLMDKGLVEKVNVENKGRWPVYRIEKKESDSVKEVHPLWNELMEYVRENGGHMKLHIRFKDGLPIEADEIKKKVRFDINARESEQS